MFLRTDQLNTSRWLDLSMIGRPCWPKELRRGVGNSWPWKVCKKWTSWWQFLIFEGAWAWSEYIWKVCKSNYLMATSRAREQPICSSVITGGEKIIWKVCQRWKSPGVESSQYVLQYSQGVLRWPQVVQVGLARWGAKKVLVNNIFLQLIITVID